MPLKRDPILISWSGGKDSALMLSMLQKSPAFEPVGLFTTVCSKSGLVNMHGVTPELIQTQAQAIGLPVEFVQLPHPCPNDLYTAEVSALLKKQLEKGVRHVAFGDLFLDDLRDFRETLTESCGIEAVFPLWHRDTRDLSHNFIVQKFKAVVTCVDTTGLDPSMAGRLYDRSFLADLPICTDPCGENGEFHAFVYDGPIFREPLNIECGDTYQQNGFTWCQIRTRTPGRKTVRGKASKRA